jgi:hypothetical protein
MEFNDLLGYCMNRIYNAKGEPVAIFAFPGDGNVMITSATARRYRLAMEDWPEFLMGHYTKGVSRQWVADDLRFMGMGEP